MRFPPSLGIRPYGFRQAGKAKIEVEVKVEVEVEVKVAFYNRFPLSDLRFPIFFCRKAKLMAGDPRSDALQPLINPLVSAVDLVNIVDNAGAIGREGGDQQSDSGPNIW